MRTAALVCFVVCLVVFPGLSQAQPAASLPSSVKTCQDALAYVDKDGTMTMETFKKLMTAAGWDLGSGGGHSLDMQCKAAPYVKNDVMLQHVFKKTDGSIVAINAHIVQDGDVCKLTQITWDGC